MKRINIYAGPVIVSLRHYRSLAQNDVLERHHLEDWFEAGLDAKVIPTTSMQDIYWIIAEIERSGGKMVQVTDSKDLAAKPDGAMGIFISAEETLLEQDIERLYTLPRLGVSTFTFSHNRQNPWCTGCHERYEGGFTYMGVAALKVLETLPLVVDLVHTSKRSFWDAVENYDGPLMVSHTGAAAVFDHPRCVDDDQLKAIAERDGVIGAIWYRSYLGEDPEKVTIDTMCDHIIHMRDTVGADHVAVGADLLEAPPEVVAPSLLAVDPTGTHKVNIDIFIKGPEGCEDITKIGKLAARLAERGLGDDEIEKIMAGSYLRVVDTVRKDVRA